MNQYETVFILTPVLSDVQMKEAVEKFKGILTAEGAEIVNEENWGLKKLAYPIQKKSTGFYQLIEFNAEPTVIEKLEINFRRDERVIRFLTFKQDKYAAEYAAKRRSVKSTKKSPDFAAPASVCALAVSGAFSLPLLPQPASMPQTIVTAIKSAAAFPILFFINNLHCCFYLTSGTGLLFIRPQKIKYIPFLIRRKHKKASLILHSSKKSEMLRTFYLSVVNDLSSFSLNNNLLQSASFLSAVLHSTSRTRFIQANSLQLSYHH